MIPSIVASLTNFLSRKMPSSCPMCSLVSFANLVGSLVVKSTCGSLPWPKPGMRALELGAGVDDGPGILVRAVRIVGVFLVGDARAALTCGGTILNSRTAAFFEQPLQLVRVLERRHFDQQAVRCRLSR
jgi:hypothetical protein